jgi:serine/threonine protein kinase
VALKKPIPFGKYYLLDRINVGGMAEVFKAKTLGVEGFERLVAVKRILPNIAEDEEFITMFIDEAKISVQLNHANIGQVFDLGKVDDSYFIALEFIDGKDLRAIFDRCRQGGEPMAIAEACFIIMKICEGLDYAHNKREPQGQPMYLVHRDVSPQNILISYEGEVKVIDFGIAKAVGKASKTEAGILKGKFSYMSPEQVRGLPIDRRSDIFSLGIIFYELLTGERLFVGESDFSTLDKVRNVDIRPPSSYNRRVPEELERISLKALAKDVDDRYPHAIDLHDDLQAFMYTAGEFYSRKDLASWMKRTFSADIEREADKDNAWSALPVGALGESSSGSRDELGLDSGVAAETSSIEAPTNPGGNRERRRNGDWGDEEVDTLIYGEGGVEPEAIPLGDPRQDGGVARAQPPTPTRPLLQDVSSLSVTAGSDPALAPEIISVEPLPSPVRVHANSGPLLTTLPPLPPPRPPATLPPPPLVANAYGEPGGAPPRLGGGYGGGHLSGAGLAGAGLATQLPSFNGNGNGNGNGHHHDPSPLRAQTAVLTPGSDPPLEQGLLPRMAAGGRATPSPRLPARPAYPQEPPPRLTPAAPARPPLAPLPSLTPPLRPPQPLGGHPALDLSPEGLSPVHQLDPSRDGGGGRGTQRPPRRGERGTDERRRPLGHPARRPEKRTRWWPWVGLLVVAAGLYGGWRLRAREAAGMVVITSRPADVRVLVDDKPMTLDGTPATLSLKPGLYRISVQREGYASMNRMVEVRAGETLRPPPFELQSTQGEVVIRSEPEGAQVVLDGQQLSAVTPLKISSLAPGQHRIEVRGVDGYREWSQEIEVVPGGSQEVTARLVVSVVRARVETLPPGAKVYLAGDAAERRYLGISPVDVRLDPSVRYTVELEKRGCRTRSEELSFGAGLKSHKVAYTLDCSTAAPEPEPPRRSVVRGAGPSRASSRPRGAKARAPVARQEPRGAAAEDVEPKTPQETEASGDRSGDGVLNVNSRPWAQVFLDGKELGAVPLRGVKVAPGAHKLTLVNDEFGIKKTYSVDVKADEEVTFFRRLDE